MNRSRFIYAATRQGCSAKAWLQPAPPSGGKARSIVESAGRGEERSLDRIRVFMNKERVIDLSNVMFSVEGGIVNESQTVSDARRMWSVRKPNSPHARQAALLFLCLRLLGSISLLYFTKSFLAFNSSMPCVFLSFWEPGRQHDIGRREPATTLTCTRRPVLFKGEASLAVVSLYASVFYV
jgi:hypothetical protein